MRRPPHRVPKKTRTKRVKGGAQDFKERERILREAACSSLVIGVDPDLHTAGVCLLQEGSPRSVGVARAPKGMEGQYCAAHLARSIDTLLGEYGKRQELMLIVVEGQRIRKGGDGATKNPQSIVDLAACGGAILGALTVLLPAAQVLVVEPQTWKGGVPKQIHQSRLCDKLGWHKKVLKSYTRPIKPDVQRANDFREPEWAHVMDGVGLALWGWAQLERVRA